LQRDYVSYRHAKALSIQGRRPQARSYPRRTAPALVRHLSDHPRLLRIRPCRVRRAFQAHRTRLARQRDRKRPQTFRRNSTHRAGDYREMRRVSSGARQFHLPASPSRERRPHGAPFASPPRVGARPQSFLVIARQRDASGERRPRSRRCDRVIHPKPQRSFGEAAWQLKTKPTGKGQKPALALRELSRWSAVPTMSAGKRPRMDQPGK
jgi:hypothetical protein